MQTQKWWWRMRAVWYVNFSW